MENSSGTCFSTCSNFEPERPQRDNPGYKNRNESARNKVLLESCLFNVISINGRIPFCQPSGQSEFFIEPSQSPREHTELITSINFVSNINFIISIKY